MADLQFVDIRTRNIASLRRSRRGRKDWLEFLFSDSTIFRQCPWN